ncbi:MAG: hypothetical protein ACJ0IZ_00365 [Verrucomicrobiales bacterium]|jgi:hypothetical protein|nr:hypothetical protein [Verrucomicrobiales bacterium]|tara:strand:+ start:301 stop:1326 length:1026 start_codon:yes stop_codon:yes gene_type:complete
MEISKRKKSYPVSSEFKEYLFKYGRHQETIPKIYSDLHRFNEAIQYESPDGSETNWQTVMYKPNEMAELRSRLTSIYVNLKMGGDAQKAKHLDVERIDFGVFGNSRPFRIRIINRYNDNFDHYYVKVADASRVYGLELEHILSPTRINYLVNGGTLIEEHIAGLPGNVFLKDLQKREDLHAVRVAKEFVKFNERCFVRLLGDMRSVNYVVDMTPDFEEVQYRVRPIDFDQQSYEGNRKIYLAQFFADNFPIVDMVMNLLNQETIEQYQKEERTLISRRYRSAERRVGELLDLMSKEQLSTPEKTKQLNQDLAEHYQTNIFKNADTMGKIVRTHIEYLLGLS